MVSSFSTSLKHVMKGFHVNSSMPENSLKSFEISSTVRWGCLLSPLFFLFVLDWMTKKAYRNSGHPRTLTSKLKDLA